MADDAAAPPLADELFVSKQDRSLRQLPGLAASALRLVWTAARGVFMWTVVLQIATGLLLAVQVTAGRYLLAHLIGSSGSRDFHSSIPWVVAIAVTLALSAAATVLRTELQRLLAELVSRYSLQRVVDAATSADLIRFESPQFHDRLQRAVVNAAMRPIQMTTGLMAVGSAGFTSLAVAIALATIQPWLLVLALIAVVPVTVMSMSVGRALYRFAVEQTPLDRERTYLQQLLTEKDSAKEIRAYGLAGYLGNRYADLYESRLLALRRLVRIRILRGVGAGLAAGVLTGSALGLLLFMVSDRQLSLAAAGASVVALVLLSSQLQGMAGGVGALYESALYIQDFDDFVSVIPELDHEGSIRPVPCQIGAVRAEALSFTYPSRAEPSLRQIDLTVEPGQVVALVGENGSGKSTLAKLLAGLYRPGDGRITWDGLDTADLPRAEARRKVAVLFQDFVRYFLSVHENIALGACERIDERDSVVVAATRSGADRFLVTLPRGYDTVLGPQFFGGSDLSGGQWQRVALARAFFRDAELVILDEPTAALDPKAEAALFSAVRELFHGRSVLLISHRFASVRLADHIYVMEDGQVIEHGSHSELMAIGSTYAEMFTLQAQAFGMPSDTI